MLEVELQKLGMEGREARVYLAALKLGKARAAEIAAESGFERTYCYTILENLEREGLIKKIEPKGEVANYICEDPKKIKEMAKERLEIASKALLKLRSLYEKESSEPSVTLYRGADGIVKIYRELEKCKSKKGLGIIDPTLAYEKTGDILTRDINRCARRGVVVDDLVAEGSKLKKFLAEKTRQKAKIRVLPANLRFDNDFLIFDNKVAQISFFEPIHGFIIESESIAKAWRNIYKALWVVSKKVESRK
jgi:sugar-specific transcriptional regulator TrmB